MIAYISLWFVLAGGCAHTVLPGVAAPLSSAQKSNQLLCVSMGCTGVPVCAFHARCPGVGWHGFGVCGWSLLRRFWHALLQSWWGGSLLRRFWRALLQPWCDGSDWLLRWWGIGCFQGCQPCWIEYQLAVSFWLQSLYLRKILRPAEHCTLHPHMRAAL